jgi:transcriptional regulator of acetoin/glycerol metabolism
MEVLLDDVPAWLWQRFHDHAARIEAPHAFTPVVERWRRATRWAPPPTARCPTITCCAARPCASTASGPAPWPAAATRTLDETQAFLAQRGYLLLLADPDGVVVSTRGGGAFADEARRVRLIEGACWSEAVRGTNAIGTALTEAQPTAVKGHAHYGRRFQNLVCYAAPICGPDGRVVGVLDATSSLERADDVVGFTVTAAARALEDALRQGAYASAGAAVARALTQAFERVRGPVLLIEPPGRIARANAAAHALLGDAGGTRVQATLGLSFGVLLAEAADAAATGLALTVRGADGRPRTMRAFVDPIAAVDGSVIALVVYLEDRVGPAAARTLAPADPFAALFSADPAVDTALGFARTMAASTVPIMILAETGAGKELVASAIHRASPRRDGPFVAVNCGAIAPSLLESELFGYAPGAFSGAERAGRAGYLAEASGGTLFLDEVAEMPPAMQAALLRVLEDGTYRRGRRGPADPRRRPHRHRHLSRPASRGGRGPVPPGSLLPAQGRDRDPAGLARAPRSGGPGRAPGARAGGASGSTRADAGTGAGGVDRGLPVAGQRPRAEDRPRRRPGAGRGSAGAGLRAPAAGSGDHLHRRGVTGGRASGGRGAWAPR